MNEQAIGHESDEFKKPLPVLSSVVLPLARLWALLLTKGP